MKPWSPVIPGTDIDRMTFLIHLQRVNNAVPGTAKLFQPVNICDIAKVGVLNAKQIAGIVHCSVHRVKLTMKTAGLENPNTRGKLEPRALETMYLACQRMALGKRLDPELLEGLVPFVSAVLLQQLTGIPEIAYHRARIRREAQQ